MLRHLSASLILTLLLVAAAPPIQAKVTEKSTSVRLIDYYAQRKNYRKVTRDVLRWHKTTKNGCVAFASTALRHIGFEIPEREKHDGYGVSRITFTFSWYLEELGWKEVTKPQNLRPGDIVFTTGYPDHVFVFHSWSHAKRRIARVIDNKGFRTERKMFPKPGSADAAFAYALRSPGAQKRP